MVRRNLSLRLKEHKGCKQTEHDYTTRRDFLFLKVNKTFNGKSKICRPNSLNCQYVAKSLKKNGKILTLNDSANSKFASSYQIASGLCESWD